MVRIHAFEFEDLQWFPPSFRGYLTDFLKFSWQFFGLAKPVAEKLIPFCSKTDVRLIDLCSGSGGPVAEVRREMEKLLGRPVCATLSDLYPNEKAFARHAASSDGRIDYIAETLSATKASAPGLWTIFCAFHHLPPEIAVQVLRNAAEKNNPIAIFELTDRSLLSLFLTGLNSSLGTQVYAPFIKPFSWKRLFWTYVIPIIPLVTIWDGTVSCLRSYTDAELRKMVEGIGANDYRWEIGRVRKGLATISFCIGAPRT